MASTTRGSVRVVAGSYFRAMGIPLLRGRLFEDQDGTSGPSVVIVNQAMARQVFPGEDPIGRDLSVSWGERSASRIVGVVGDVKHDSLDGQVRPMIYWPVAQSPYRTMAIVLRTDGDPRNVLPPAVAEVHRLDPDILVSRIRTLEEIVTSSVARPAFLLRLMTLFAALAILLAAVGIYGLLSHAVSRRTHEMGIRTAVGAARADILRLVMGESLLLAALGLALGLAGTSVLGRFLRALLFEVSATDPAVLAGVSLLLALVALLAAYLPARRAASVDPIRALRYQ